MKIARKYNVPDKCPANCPYIEEYKKYNMGFPCRVCPVFLCKTLTYNGESINLVSPDSYPSEHAKEWAKWFEEGMSGNTPGE